jgi:CRP-like cAMP-binding protein
MLTVGEAGRMSASAGQSTSREQLLASQSLFSMLDAKELSALAAASHAKHLRAGDELCHKGDAGSQIYVIVSGRLKAMTTSANGDDVVFSIMGPGETVGELAMLSGRPRSASVVAIDDCELIALERREFVPFLRAHPEASIKLLERLARRLEHISELVEDTQFRNLPGRLAKRLLELGERYGAAGPDGLRIELRLSQAALGTLVATSRESVNKQLRAWADAGLVSTDHGIVTLRDPPALEELVNGLD